MQLAQRIRAFRKLKGFTQQELAEKSGVSLALLGAVERGNRRADEQMLTKITQCLGISLAELKSDQN